MRILWFEDRDLYTVRRGIEAGRALGVDVAPLDLTDLQFTVDSGNTGVFRLGRDLADEYDGIIMRNFMPFVSEALTIARLFSERGRTVVDASLIDEGYAMSKMHDYLVLAGNGIEVPFTRQLFDAQQAEEFASELGFPCILKGIHGSEGRHVHKIDSREQFKRKMFQYRTGELMVQEFLEAEEDYRVITVGYKALPFYVSRKPREGEFRTNFELNEEVVSHRISEYPSLKDVAELAAKTLRREFCAVDIRCKNNKPLVLEANRRPGFKGFEQATGHDVAKDFIRYVAKKCESDCDENK